MIDIALAFDRERFDFDLTLSGDGDAPRVGQRKRIHAAHPARRRGTAGSPKPRQCRRRHYLGSVALAWKYPVASP